MVFVAKKDIPHYSEHDNFWYWRMLSRPPFLSVTVIPTNFFCSVALGFMYLARQFTIVPRVVRFLVPTPAHKRLDNLVYIVCHGTSRPLYTVTQF